MAKPELDAFFRRKGRLDDLACRMIPNLIFVVDNGPSEKPNSPMLHMLLVRMVNS